MEKLLDVAVELDSAVVAQQRLRVLLLQEQHAAQCEVRQRLPAVADDRRAEELRRFGVGAG